MALLAAFNTARPSRCSRITFSGVVPEGIQPPGTSFFAGVAQWQSNVDNGQWSLLVLIVIKLHAHAQTCPFRYHRRLYSSLLSQSLYAIPTREHSRTNPASRVCFFDFLADATQLGTIARHQSSASLRICHRERQVLPGPEQVSKLLLVPASTRDKSVLDHRFLMRFTGPVQ